MIKTFAVCACLAVSATALAVPNCPGIAGDGTNRFTVNPTPYPQSATELQICAGGLYGGERDAIRQLFTDGRLLDRYPRDYAAMWVVARVNDRPYGLKPEGPAIANSLEAMLARPTFTVAQADAIMALYADRLNFNVTGLSEESLVRGIMAFPSISEHQVRNIQLMLSAPTPHMGQLVEGLLQECVRARLAPANNALVEFYINRVLGPRNSLGQREPLITLGDEANDVDEVIGLLSSRQIGAMEVGNFTRLIEIWMGDKARGERPRRLKQQLQEQMARGNPPMCEQAQRRSRSGGWLGVFGL